jgi:hypothetical protein
MWQSDKRKLTFSFFFLYAFIGTAARSNGTSERKSKLGQNCRLAFIGYWIDGWGGKYFYVEGHELPAL